MYLIALCDDEISELKKAEQMLGSYKEKYSDKDIRTDYFKSARELLEMVRNEGYMPDLLLLDIYMPDKMGIEAAKELRDMGNKSRIVFLTTSKEHALEAFGVNAVQYLVKPVSESMLFPLLDRLLEDIERERKKYLVLRVKGRVQRVPVDEIVYCEAQGKTQCLHLADDTQCMLRVTMAEIYGLLSGYPEFVRVGIAYIVNPE